MTDDRVKIADELIQLHEKLKPFATDWKRYDALRKRAREWPVTDKTPGNSEATYTTKSGDVVLGQCEYKTDWLPGANAKLFGVLGQERFLAVAKVTLTAARDAVSESVVADLTDTAQTGSRDITIVAKPWRDSHKPAKKKPAKKK